MPNIETILRDHITLQVDCIDRVYLNGYVPALQRPDQLRWFLYQHMGYQFVSPAVLKKMTDSFVAAIESFAQENHIPIVRFERGARKEEIARKRMARFRGDEGVVFIGVAQEKVCAFRSFQKGPRRRPCRIAQPVSGRVRQVCHPERIGRRSSRGSVRSAGARGSQSLGRNRGQRFERFNHVPVTLGSWRSDDLRGRRERA